jgi:hypothetical protein
MRVPLGVVLGRGIVCVVGRGVAPLVVGPCIVDPPVVVPCMVVPPVVGPCAADPPPVGPCIVVPPLGVVLVRGIVCVIPPVVGPCIVDPQPPHTDVEDPPVVGPCCTPPPPAGVRIGLGAAWAGGLETGWLCGLARCCPAIALPAPPSPTSTARIAVAEQIRIALQKNCVVIVSSFPIQSLGSALHLLCANPDARTST